MQKNVDNYKLINNQTKSKNFMKIKHNHFNKIKICDKLITIGDNMKEEIKKKKKKNNKATFNLLEVIVIIVMTSLVVGVSTGIVVYNNYYEIDKKNNKGNTNYLKEIEAAYNNILNSYVEKVDESELTNAAIKGMYSYLGDPYTSYLDEDSTTNLMDRLNGEYKGIGVEITSTESGTMVMTVFDGSPASKAGIMVGDIITKVGDTDVKNSTPSVVSNLIKSTNGTTTIEVLRGGVYKTLEINVEKVSIPSVSSNNFDGVGYIKITTFSNNTYEQFKTALSGLEKENIDSLVIDVRNNGGGFLNAAVDIAELFIEKGKNVYGLETKEKTEYYKDSTKESRNYKVGILMNSASASASEILAAALKESYGATLLGITSYGKGTVQETSELETGGMIKYTTAYWLTPNGNKINNVGLKPDVEITGDYTDDMDYESDTQLLTAIKNMK